MVSIIIPVYNRKSLLKLTLDSLQKCDLIDKDIIIVDDGSTEDIEGMLLSNFPDLKYNYFKIPNQGASVARNIGISKSKGKYILFLDSDDLVEKGFFSERVKFLNLNPNLDAVYGPWDHVTALSTLENYTVIPRLNPYPIYDPDHEKFILKNLLGGWYINQCSILWRKEFIERIEGFDSTLRINQDVDLVFRALMNKIKIAGACMPRTFYRDHDQLRVGNFQGNSLKLKQILNLRKDFIEKLEKHHLLSNEYREELGYFLFQIWSDNRKSSPQVANQFLELSKNIKPDLKVRGGKIYVLLARLFGNTNATVFKQIFR